MIPVTSEFKKAVANDNRNYIIKIDMTLDDGTNIPLDNSDIWEGGVTFEEATSNANSFDIGATVIGKCQIVLNNIYDKFTEYDLYNATFWLYIGLQLGETTEMIRKGFYTVDETKYNGSLITLNCLDNMWKFDVPYSEISTAYPNTIGVIIADICAHCGVTLGKADFPNYNYIISKRPEEEMNCREVISFLAQISCLYARISREGMLVMQWYGKHSVASNVNGGYFDNGIPLYKSGDNLYGGTFEDWDSADDYSGGTFDDWENIHTISSSQSMSVSTDDIVITGIRVLSDKNGAYDVLCGTDEYALAIKDNPFVNEDNAEDVARYVGMIIAGMHFRPFTASVLDDVTIEAGDMCIINDFRGNVYYSYVTNLSFTIGNYESLSCGAESPTKNKTVRYSESAKTTVQIRKEAQEQISTYDKTVQNMNQLAMNTMGFYSSSETLDDGSTIAYLHNKPTREESTTIYKMTSDGFFVSRDGGESYTSGFDAEGNAVLNILSVIGIQFDWARGGTLALGGFDNKNGVIHIYSALGEHVGTIDNNGISFYSSVSKLQIVISPITGFYQRDADGNEFWGLSYDETIHLPAYSNIRRNETYIGSDSDEIVETKLLSEMTSDYNYRAQYKYEYKHKSAEWKKTTTYPSGKSSVTLQLPNSFKGKKWIVNLMYKGINAQKSSNEYLCSYAYGKLPLCYEGEYRIGPIITGGVTVTLIGDRETRQALIDNAAGHPTTYLSYPEEGSSGTYDIRYRIPDIITDYEFDYIKDEEKGTLTITGKAMSNDYCINELMDIRVLVTC
ncbi:MAG: hypothetical protein K2N15_10830 [Lachnospiraceae bacterium]|nr:hypothetical protein [Lachnospiraceae bacterium]